ncbi:hypothetical protein EI171_29110 [Bradyrhizobium sp. LCT2]|uniref:hypothetical protein n=1 Tax=Bradyrhizobium sp. LCT2 TaxID=2493093 RepID=UPI001373C086|nr:hypothetical protein [Bradyrhizobium sp. LCT2]QHP70995.1 hypothetical protein EI171_29110 [Bradyrhizobium sp. LCT2]
MSTIDFKSLRAQLAADSVRSKAELQQRIEMRERGDFDDQIIHKTYQPEPEPAAPAAPPRLQGVMSPEMAAQWNGWLHASVSNALAAHSGQLHAHLTARDETICKLVGEVVGREVKKLREEIGVLRAQTTLLETVAKHRIIALPTKSKSNAA